MARAPQGGILVVFESPSNRSHLQNKESNKRGALATCQERGIMLAMVDCVLANIMRVQLGLTAYAFRKALFTVIALTVSVKISYLNIDALDGEEKYNVPLGCHKTPKGLATRASSRVVFVVVGSEPWSMTVSTQELLRPAQREDRAHAVSSTMEQDIMYLVRWSPKKQRKGHEKFTGSCKGS